MITLKLKNAEALALQRAAWMGVADMESACPEDYSPREVRDAEQAASKLNDAVRHLHKQER